MLDSFFDLRYYRNANAIATACFYNATQTCPQSAGQVIVP